jgi:hypothetical protein
MIHIFNKRLDIAIKTAMSSSSETDAMLISVKNSLTCRRINLNKQKVVLMDNQGGEVYDSSIVVLTDNQGGGSKKTQD